MPLYILTSRNTFSAAEDFTYAMQVNKRAVIVGGTTGGRSPCNRTGAGGAGLCHGYTIRPLDQSHHKNGPGGRRCPP